MDRNTLVDGSGGTNAGWIGREMRNKFGRESGTISNALFEGWAGVLRPSLQMYKLWYEWVSYSPQKEPTKRA